MINHNLDRFFLPNHASFSIQRAMLRTGRLKCNDVCDFLHSPYTCICQSHTSTLTYRILKRLGHTNTTPDNPRSRPGDLPFQSQDRKRHRHYQALTARPGNQSTTTKYYLTLSVAINHYAGTPANRDPTPPSNADELFCSKSFPLIPAAIFAISLFC